LIVVLILIIEGLPPSLPDHIICHVQLILSEGG